MWLQIFAFCLAVGTVCCHSLEISNKKEQRDVSHMSEEDKSADSIMHEILGICIYENPAQTVKKLLTDTQTIIDNIDVYKEVVKKNKQLRNEIKWILSESKGKKETSRIVELLKRDVKRTCSSEKYGIHKDCTTLQKYNPNLPSGVYMIYPSKVYKGLKVYCDMTTDAGGWTVIQRRTDGNTSFDRTWVEYENGFGNKAKEYWLGNKYIHTLTSTNKYELRIDLTDQSNKKTYAVYSTFSIGDSSSKYAIRIGGYTGNAGDHMSANNNKKFTTKDNDNDTSSGNCATSSNHGAWWHWNCSYVDLNLPYKSRLRWSGYSYLQSVMMIRRLN